MSQKCIFTLNYDLILYLLFSLSSLSCTPVMYIACSYGFSSDVAVFNTYTSK